MPNFSRLRGARRLLVLAAVALLPFTGCNCVDRIGSDPWEFGTDAGLADIGYDTDRPDDAEIPPDVDDARDIPIDTWQPEDVVADVECEDALTDRTSTIVDREGTTWVGFHQYRGGNCDSIPTLVVARKPLGGTWSLEDIQPQRGIFGLSSIRPGHPIAVYPDAHEYGSGTFRAAHRDGRRDWEIHEFDVGERVVGRWDGFDVTEDGESFWVTFARDDGEMVRLFEYDTTAPNPEWRGRAPLPIPDPEPAMARGLRANSGDSVYLVHKNPRKSHELFGVARYDKGADAWPAREYLDDISAQARVHSLTITDTSELCLSNAVASNRYADSGELVVTCGTMSDLDRTTRRFPEQTISNSLHPSSITEGRDGTLYVAFHPPSNSRLRLAKREPGGSWSIQTIFDGSAAGVSTAIDLSGDLVLSFYTCNERGNRCSLKVLRERPDQL